MVYFCADDYGIANTGNSRIEECLNNGALNKISVLPNGNIDNINQLLSKENVKFSLHINLVEGKPLSAPEDINLLIDANGCFKHSFIGLMLLSLSAKRKQMEEQLYKEIKKQVLFWLQLVGNETPLSLDSHQHTHMIPLVFKTLLKVLDDEKIKVEFIRVAEEPILVYLFTPSLYFSYTLSGILKQWLLKFFAVLNRKRLKNATFRTSYFIGAMFSGRITEDKVKKLLPKYLKVAEKNNKDIELAFHPAFIENSEELMDTTRIGFGKFYISEWRKKEYDTLINFK